MSLNVEILHYLKETKLKSKRINNSILLELIKTKKTKQTKEPTLFCRRISLFIKTYDCPTCFGSDTVRNYNYH